MRKSSFLNPAGWSAILTTLSFVAILGGCGGNSTTSPSSSAPPSLPTLSSCDVISGSAHSILGILNGTECPATQSSVVLVNMRDKDDQPTGACSGTVIAARAVLTAAHCLSGDTASVRIWTGAGAEIQTTSFQADPAYRGDASSDPAGDVGVVITAADVNRTPIPLLVSRDARVGEQAVIGGWGKDINGNGTRLRAGVTTISATGAAVLQTQYSTSSSSVCSGDSGGPLLLQEGGVWAVVGVTSATTVGGSCATGTNYFANVRNPDVSSFIFGIVPNASRR